MDNPVTSSDHEETDHLAAAKHTRTSTILNGVGNGMMIGTIPFVLVESYARISEKHIPRSVSIGSLVATVVGAIVGGIFGSKEADQLESYRKATHDEITTLQNKLREQEAQIRTWSQTVRSEESASTGKSL